MPETRKKTRHLTNCRLRIEPSLGRFIPFAYLYSREREREKETPRREKMGIPRFGLRIRNHARKTTLGVANSSTTTTTTTESPSSSHLLHDDDDDDDGPGVAIIDGPGLAHHIYHGLCENSSSSSSSTFTVITYGDCVHATIEWLDQLQGYGFRMYVPYLLQEKKRRRKDVWMYGYLYISDDPVFLETPYSSTAHSPHPKKTSESIDCRVISHD